MPDPSERCIKSMRFGPCGGTRSDGTCEVGDRRCPFVDAVPPTWPGAARSPRPIDVPRYVVDLRPGDDAARNAAALDVLGSGVAVLVGDHVDDPPALRAGAIAPKLADAGAQVIATVTARDRSIAECDRIIADLVEAGVLAVLCVTGDHPAVRLGSDRTARFATDSFGLIDLARQRDAIVAAAESPASPPVDHRSHRVRSKQDAGTDVVVLNHAGPPDALIDFARACSSKGTTIPLVAPVPVVTDSSSARALIQFPGLVIDPEVARIGADGASPTEERAAGVELAAQTAKRLLGSGEFESVNLSGSASPGGLLDRCATMRDVIDRCEQLRHASR